MPILATPVLNNDRQVRAEPIAETRALDFWSVDGTDRLQWDGTGARGTGEFIAAGEITGLDVPPRDVVTDTVQGLPGGRLREIKQGIRTVVLPVFILSDDYATSTHLHQLARVRAFMAYHDLDYQSAEGTFDLVATSKDLSGRDQQRFLRCTYVDGMPGSLGWSQGGGGPYFSSFALQLLAVQPFWRGQPWSTPVVGIKGSSPFLSNNPTDGFPRQLTPSVALGADMALSVGGDVPSPAVVRITGPAGTGTTISTHQGLNINLTGAVLAGQTLVVDTGDPAGGRRKTVTLDVGDGNGPRPAWSLVGGSPVWEPLPPGDTTISVEVVGGTTATSAVVYGTSLWETAW